MIKFGDTSALCVRLSSLIARQQISLRASRNGRSPRCSGTETAAIAASFGNFARAPRGHIQTARTMPLSLRDWRESGRGPGALGQRYFTGTAIRSSTGAARRSAPPRNFHFGRAAARPFGAPPGAARRKSPLGCCRSPRAPRRPVRPRRANSPHFTPERGRRAERRPAGNGCRAEAMPLPSGQEQRIARRETGPAPAVRRPFDGALP